MIFDIKVPFLTRTVQSVECPRCQAMIGAKCRTPGNHIINDPHGERQKAYRRELNKHSSGVTVITCPEMRTGH